jgi:hypothetical protein
MTAQDMLWAVAGGALLLAVLAALGEHRRSRRRNLEQVGWVPWNFIQVVAGIAAVIAVVLALRA